MPHIPESVAEFLRGRRIVVAGVSRSGDQPANAILRKLRGAGYDVVAVNPNAAEIEGEPCYPNLAAVPGTIDGVIVAVPPSAAINIVRQAAGRGVARLWFHRSFGSGSVSPEAVRECESRGIRAIVGGCPLMYCEPVDLGHRCFRWWLRLQRRVPG